MPLLERSSHLAELSRHLGATAAGEGRMVFVGGEAGIGKTSLVHAFCRSAEAARILRGACDPLTTPRPLGPVLEMLPELDPGLAERLGAGELRARILRGFLEALGRPPRPSLVVIEDAHWADDATLDLLRYLGRRVAGTGALLVVTYRDDEVGPEHPLRIVLGDLAAAQGSHRMRLAPLSETALAALIQAAGSPLDAASLHARTGGNPFYATEILAGSGDAIPETVRDAVLARAARLRPQARRALDTAAVVGPNFDADLIMTVADCELEAVEACLAGGLLVPQDGILAFRHELAREALLSAMSPTRKRSVHRRVLRTLRPPEALDAGVDAAGAEGAGRTAASSATGRGDALPVPPVASADLATLAHHAEGAGDADAVLAYAPAAARQATRVHAHREAAAQYARALRHAAGRRPAERAELWEGYAAELQVIDRTDAAIDAYARAADLRAETGDVAAWVMDRARMARPLMAAGRNAEAERVALDALTRSEDLPFGRERTTALVAWAYLRMLDRDADRALEGALRAIDAARAIDEPSLLVHALNVVGSAHILSGSEAAGREALEESLRLSLEAELDDRASDAYGNLGSGLGEVYRFRDAERYLTEGIAFCEERDLDYQRVYMLAWLALTRTYQGRWTEAAALASSVARRPGASAISRVMALAALGRLRVRRGDPEAWAVLDEALAIAERSATLQRVAPVRAARAEAAWTAGDAEGAAREARAAYDLALEKHHAWFVGELSYWLWQAGDLDAPPAAAAQPFALEMEGDAEAAAAAWAERGCPYEQGRALASVGTHNAAKRAAVMFTDLGARPALEALARRMDGVRVPPRRRGPRPSTRANPAGLTRRQMEVLELLAEGLTNAEIAERLVRAEKTVSHHVSAILGKLEVRNRTEAAQRASELGLTDRAPPDDET